MKIIKTIAAVKKETRKLKGKTFGFVPTMGCLHQGHLSLMEQSLRENDVTVVSIFVNPTQFAPNEDLDSYPRDLKKDEKSLKELGVDILFFPDVKEIYPGGYSTYVQVEELYKVLCGKSRPTHFRGVTTVVLKLFNIVAPDNAYFGSKDAQQAVIIKKMALDLNLDVTIKALPIVRDTDGLALSSRNTYLSGPQREAALCLPKALRKAEELIAAGLEDAAQIKTEIVKELQQSKLVEIDYVEIVSLNSLKTYERSEGTMDIDVNNTLVAAAVKLGKTRLIDNFILGEI
ncbi:MAG: pantoate--beta-alanine ligase [Candidatus Aminicenantes bacterium]|nr:pantoate--beta-alanine ligase [Candidatus Aminicenantes bacterium]